MKNQICIIFFLFFAKTNFCEAQNVLDGVLIKNSAVIRPYDLLDFSLTGTVTDSITGNPVVDATIELVDKNCPSVFVKSDKKGFFSFKNINICSRKIYINCSKTGYKMKSISQEYNRSSKYQEFHTVFELQKMD
jgi:Carboxypeptidase regulatory-like domain